MPIFGITASSNMTNKLTDFDSIATTVIGTATSSVTFSSIPQTYKHLQIRVLNRNTTGYDAFDLITLNSTATRTHYLLGINNQALSGTNTNSIFGPAAYGNASGWDSRIFGVGIIDILDYTNTNINKTVRTLTGVDGNAAGGLVALNSGYAATTSAVTTITITSQGTNFGQYSSFALYGIKG